MRKILFSMAVLLVLIYSNLSAQWNWTDDQKLSDTQSSDELYTTIIQMEGLNTGQHQIAVPQYSKYPVHVVWCKKETDDYYRVYYKRKTVVGWSNDKLLQPAPLHLHSQFPSFSIATDPTGLKVYVIWHEEMDAKCQLYITNSSDGGVTWNPPSRITTDYDCYYEPNIAIGSDGRAYIVWSMGYMIGTNGLHSIGFAVGNFDGVNWSWEITKQIDPTDNIGDEFEPGIDTDPIGGGVHIAWRQCLKDGTERIVYRNYNINNSSFGPLVEITKMDNSTYLDMGSPTISCSKDGSHFIHIAWVDDSYDQGSGNTDVYYKRSTDNGETWGNSVLLSENGSEDCISKKPSISVCSENGNYINLLYYEYNKIVDYSEKIYFRKSSDAGCNWSDISEVPLNGIDNDPGLVTTGVNNESHIIFSRRGNDFREMFYKFNYLDNISLNFTYPKIGDILLGGYTTNIFWEVSDAVGIDHFDIYFSNDGCKTWESIALNLSADLRKYSYKVPNIDADNCCFKIVITNVNGIKATDAVAVKVESFSAISTTGWRVEYAGSSAIRDIQMMDADNAWAVGDNGLVLRKSNGTWDQVNISNLSEYNLNAVEIKGQYGWIVGEKKDDPGKYSGILRRTTNGGDSWPDEFEYKYDGMAFKDVSFANDGTGYISCSNGIILKSTNRGLDWVKLSQALITEPSAVSGWINNVYTDPTNSANVRATCDNFGFVNESWDGGNTWEGQVEKQLADDYYKWPENTILENKLMLAPAKMNCSSWSNYSVSFNHGYVYNGSDFAQIVPDISNGTNNVPSGIWLNSLGGNEFDKSLYVGSDGFISNSVDDEQLPNQEDLIASSGVMIDAIHAKHMVGSSVGNILSSNYLPPVTLSELNSSFAPFDDMVIIDMYPSLNYQVEKYELYRSASNIGKVKYIGDMQNIGWYAYWDEAFDYCMDYHYWIKTIHPNGDYNWIYLGSCKPGSVLIPNAPDPLPAPTELTASDIPNDHGECISLTWSGTSINGFYIGRKLEGETQYKGVGYTIENEFIDQYVQNGRRYEYVVQAIDQYYQPSAYSAPAVGAAFDNLPPNKMEEAPTGTYSVYDKTMTINWLPSTDDPNFGGYWVCPEAVGVFAENISGIDPGNYEPDAYHVSHASPIDRTQWKWQVPDELIGQTLIFSVTAMDRSGNIAPWSDQVFINTKAITNSNSQSATAFNNGKHLIYDDKGRLFLVYGSGDSVLYQQSWDDGYTWTPASGFASGGTKPVPVIGYYGEDTTIFWKAETENVGWILKSAKRSGGGWLPEETVLEQAGYFDQMHTVTPPSMVMDKNGIHVAIERNDAVYSNGSYPVLWNWHLVYGFKPYGGTFTWQTLESDSGVINPPVAPRCPSIAVDSKGAVHIAWNRNGEIYWKMYNPYSSSWQAKVNLSNSPEVVSSEPSVSIYGGLHLIWQEGKDIFHKLGTWGLTPEALLDLVPNRFYWTIGENVSNTPSSASYDPVFAGNYIAWSEETGSGKYVAYYSNYVDYAWQAHVNYNNNPSQPAVYPQIAYRQNVDGNKMTTIWTEGTGPLYSLISRDEAGQVTAAYSVEAGGEEQSVYTIQRDGNIVYGATEGFASSGIINVDYDSTALEYYLPSLDKEQKQTVKFIFYQEYSDKSDYIYQVWVDNISLGTVKVPSGKSVVFEKDLPNNVSHDGDGIIKIVNLKNDKIVTCDKWEVYTYDKATGRGGGKKSGGVHIASSDSKPQAFVYAMAQNAPNPFNGQTTINYQLAKPGNVRLNIYNTLGQLVNTVVDDYKQPGMYSATWNGKDNSGRTAANGVYIYRLESGDFKATRKMVVIK